MDFILFVFVLLQLSFHARHNNSFIIRLMCNVRMGGGVCEKESISVYIFHVMYIIYTYVSLDIYLLYLYVCIHMYTFFNFFFVYLCKCLNKLYKKTKNKNQQLFNTTINTHA